MAGKFILCVCPILVIGSVTVGITGQITIMVFYLWALTFMRGIIAVELSSYVALLESKQARPLETRAHALNFEFRYNY